MLDHSVCRIRLQVVLTGCHHSVRENAHEVVHGLEWIQQFVC